METLIFLNGKLPRKSLIKIFTEKKPHIIAADGGANSLRRLGITPDIIIGDFDSVTKSTISFYSAKKVKLIKISEQETCDFEKSLIYCRGNNLNDVTVFGASSMRPDHTLNNYSILKRYYRRLNIRMLTDEFEIFFIRKKVKFTYRPGNPVSLLALPKAEKITTEGLKFPMTDSVLEFGVREGTLNESVSEKISISFGKGNLILFRKHFLNQLN